MQIRVGTSGFSYAEWCGRFYPEALPAQQMLRFYSARLPTVEINNTFYRMPNEDTVAAWRDEVPDSFCFAVKATRRITHQKKLANVGDDVAHLFRVVDVLGDKLGPVLFQLPPFLKKDRALIEEFVKVLPAGRRAALEFRHPSWFVDDVYATLSAHNVALVGGDLEESEKSPPLVVTADFGYLRLRQLDYTPVQLADWAERIAQQQRWQSVFAYLKHEVLGPLFAEALTAASKGEPMADLSEIRASLAAPKPKSARAPRASKSKPAEPPSSQAAKAPVTRNPQASAAPSSRAPASRSSKAPASKASKAPAARSSKAPASASSKSRKA